MNDALFEQSGNWFIPTELTRSPWGPDHQHGGPALALMVRAIEDEMPDGMAVWRVAADLLRPIPYAPLRVSASTVRPGKRITLIEATVSGEDGPLVLGRVWVIRRRDSLDYPDPLDPLPVPPAPPDTISDTGFEFASYTWFGDSLDRRQVTGGMDQPGAATVWFRLRVPVVAGEAPTSVQCLTAMADSGNGISWALPFGEYLFINSDLSMYLLREPVEEWFAMESVSFYDPCGRGIAETRLFDEAGYLGRSQQALFVDHMGGRS